MVSCFIVSSLFHDALELKRRFTFTDAHLQLCGSNKSLLELSKFRVWLNVHFLEIKMAQGEIHSSYFSQTQNYIRTQSYIFLQLQTVHILPSQFLLLLVFITYCATHVYLRVICISANVVHL